MEEKRTKQGDLKIVNIFDSDQRKLASELARELRQGGASGVRMKRTKVLNEDKDVEVIQVLAKTVPPKLLERCDVAEVEEE